MQPQTKQNRHICRWRNCCSNRKPRSYLFDTQVLNTCIPSQHSITRFLIPSCIDFLIVVEIYGTLSPETSQMFPSSSVSLMAFSTATTSRQALTYAHADAHTRSIVTSGAWVWAHRRQSVSFVKRFWVMPLVPMSWRTGCRIECPCDYTYWNHVQRFLLFLCQAPFGDTVLLNLKRNPHLTNTQWW